MKDFIVINIKVFIIIKIVNVFKGLYSKHEHVYVPHKQYESSSSKRT